MTPDQKIIRANVGLLELAVPVPRDALRGHRPTWLSQAR
jgi:hypothetical protein